jgi:hypothetical protein
VHAFAVTILSLKTTIAWVAVFLIMSKKVEICSPDQGFYFLLGFNQLSDILYAFQGEDP